MEDLDKLSKMMPNVWMWYKDLNSIYMQCNSRYAEMCMFKKRSAIEGLTDVRLPCKASEIAHKFQENDKWVMGKKEKQEFLAIAQYVNNENRLVLTTKIPLYDDKKNIIGTFGYGIELTNTTNHFIHSWILSLATYRATQNEYRLNDNFTTPATKLELTKRQSETPFYIIRGKTAKETAKKLHCSPRTIEQHLEQLRHKFGCHTKSDLIEKAMALGFFNCIPPGMLG